MIYRILFFWCNLNIIIELSKELITPIWLLITLFTQIILSNPFIFATGIQTFEIANYALL